VRLTGVLVGQTLRTDSAEVYRALLEATAFGARVIVERLREYGARVDEMVLCGGIAEKSPLTVQIYADVLGLPMKLSRSAQTCALGAAIFGAVAAGPQHGGFSSVPEAQERLCAVKSRVFRPEPEATRTYSQLYRLYRRLHDAFGGVPGGTAGGELGSIIKELLEVRDRVRARA
jgi:L-ribulokinase